MRSLREALEHRRDGGLEEKIDLSTVGHLFRRIVREQYGAVGEKEMEPVALEGKTLVVVTKNPLWASELIVRKSLFLEFLNQTLGQEVINDVRTVRYWSENRSQSV
jgi:predicted nucleic acid-binding Zn ribbon protein